MGYGVPFGENTLVSRFMKGNCNYKPPKPKSEVVWDPDLVLNCISCMGDHRNLNLNDLTLKAENLEALFIPTKRGNHCFTL